MRDRKWILAGLGVFCAVALFPVWYDALAGKEVAPPKLTLPTNATACVEPTQWMIANHPALLNQWRTAVVRDGERNWVSPSGKTYVMSLTGTCMSCHTNRATFCDQCHNYADVQPTCWDCHVEPQGS